jgi:hypothetical protein
MHRDTLHCEQIIAAQIALAIVNSLLDTVGAKKFIPM